MIKSSALNFLWYLEFNSDAINNGHYHHHFSTSIQSPSPHIIQLEPAKQTKTIQFKQMVRFYMIFNYIVTLYLGHLRG